MKYVVHFVCSHEIEQGWEEVLSFGNNIFRVEDIVFDNEPDDFDDLESAIAKFRSASFINLQFFYTFGDERLSQFDKIVDNGLVVGEDKGHVGKIGQ